jgi:hypothetical protein
MVSSDYCFGFVCLIPLDANAPKFFGFSEFLAGLALMVLVWTTADARYDFRVRTAPLPLKGITFVVVGALGVLTLLTDLWRAEQWLVPRGHLLTPAGWQAFLGGLFLLTFLAWAWFAFIRPPIYSKRNAQRYGQALYRVILKGSPPERSAIADEFSSSAKSLICHATDRRELETTAGTKNEEKRSKNPPKVTTYANEILLLISDKRFCRAIVESSPGTALAVFHEVGKTKKYGVQVGTFAKNIVNEALANKDSFLFHETEGHESGLIGSYKPLSPAMFSNYERVKVIGTLLYSYDSRKWDGAQWKVYCRMVLMTFHDYVEKDFWNDSPMLCCAQDKIKHAVDDLHKIDGVANSAWNDDIQARLRV